MLQHARAILRQAERLHEDLGAYGGGLAGQIRVLSNTNALTEFLPEALSSFLAAHPNVSVDLEERLSDEIVGLIAEGVADLGIVAGTVDAGALETYPFRRDRFVLVVAQRIRWRSATRSGSKRCSITISSGSIAPARCNASSPARRCASAGRCGLRVQLRTFDAVCRLVECKVGIGIVPETTARRVAEDHGDRAGAAHRSLGGARTDDLHPQAWANCRSMRGSWSSICARRSRYEPQKGVRRT